jgi:O-antigen/teichoic acid export membrane protein
MSLVGEAPVAPLPTRRLRSDVALMVVSKALALGFSLASTVVLARQLGPHGRGIVAVAFGLTLTLVQVGTFGIASANPYFVALDPGRRRDLVANSLWLGLALGLALVACGAAIKLLAAGAVAGVDWTDLVIALVSIPAVLLALFLQSILLGLGRIVAYNLVEVAQGVITLLGLIVVLKIGAGGVTAAMLVLTAAPAIAAVTYLILLRGSMRVVRPPDLSLARRMVRYAFRVYVATLLGYLLIRLDLLLVNHYLGSSQAGIYSIAATIAQGMYIFPAAVGTNLFPRIARGAQDELSARVFRVVASAYGACCLIAVPLARPVIHALYGPRFDEAVSLLYWLLPGIFSLGMLTVLSQHFAGRGFPLPAMLVWFVGLAVNMAIDIAFIPGNGAYIASLSSSIAYTLLLILHVRMFAHRVGGYLALVPRPRDFSPGALRGARKR